MSKSKFKKAVAVNPKLQQSTASLFEQCETWLAGHQKIMLIVLIVLSVVFRFGYFVQLNSGPCIWQHRFTESDMFFYDQWAKDIAAGDWLTNKSMHPFVASNQWVADYYLKEHPDEALKLQKQLGNNQSPDAIGKLLWERWDGGKIFHQDPLYIYMIAVVYKLFGADVRYVFLVQMLTGIFSILLIYLITKKYFGYTAATVSAFTAVFCGPLMFYELTLVRETFIVFAGLLLIYLTDKTLENPSKRNISILGFLIGLCILLKSTFILFLFLTLGLFLFKYRKQFQTLLLNAIILVLGAFVSYSPLMIRNALVGAPLFSQNSIGAIAVISSNDVNYNPEESYSLSLKNTSDILASSDGKTFPALIASIKTHPSVFSYLQLLGKKLLLVFHWYEFPNNKNFYYYKLQAPILNFAFINWIFIASLGLVGLAISIIHRRKLWSIYLLLLMHLFLLVMFLVLSRYRIPFEAAMIPFTGFAVAELLKNFNKNIKLSGVMLVATIGLGFYVARSLPERITLIRAADFHQPYVYYYKGLIDSAVKIGDYNSALKTMTDCMKFEPEDVKRLNRNSPTLNSYEITLIRIFAEFHSVYSNLYNLVGDKQAVQNEATRADDLNYLLALNDNTGSIESLLNKARVATGDQRLFFNRMLIDQSLLAVKANPNDLKAFLSMYEGFENLKIPDSAIYALQEALRINPDDYYVNERIGSLYGQYKNDFGNSIKYLERAVAINPKGEDAYVNLGIVYSIIQQNDKAIEMMNRAAELNPSNKNNLRNLELLLRKLGRNSEADAAKAKADKIQ